MSVKDNVLKILENNKHLLEIKSIEENIEKIENNIVSDYEIVFKGICEECQKEEVKNGIKG